MCERQRVRGNKSRARNVMTSGMRMSESSLAVVEDSSWCAREGETDRVQADRRGRGREGCRAVCRTRGRKAASQTKFCLWQA